MYEQLKNLPAETLAKELAEARVIIKQDRATIDKLEAALEDAKNANTLLQNKVVRCERDLEQSRDYTRTLLNDNWLNRLVQTVVETPSSGPLTIYRVVIPVGSFCSYYTVAARTPMEARHYHPLPGAKWKSGCWQDASGNRLTGVHSWNPVDSTVLLEWDVVYGDIPAGHIFEVKCED